MVNRVYQIFGRLFCALSLIFFTILSSTGLAQMGPKTAKAASLEVASFTLGAPARLGEAVAFSRPTDLQDFLRPHPVSVAALAEDTPLITKPAPELEEPLAAVPAVGAMELTTAYLVAPRVEPVYQPHQAPQAAGEFSSANVIQIAGNTVEIVDTGYNIVESGGHANKFGGKFLYGHNSAAVFGGIVGMGAGSIFSVTENGVKTTYVVARAAILEKVGEQTLRISGHNVQMNVVAGASLEGASYDLAVMTCYGEMLPGGDATHRYVLFANRL